MGDLFFGMMDIWGTGFSSNYPMLFQVHGVRAGLRSRFLRASDCGFRSGLYVSEGLGWASASGRAAYPFSLRQ